MTAALEIILKRVAKELEPLLRCDCNWQIVIHGGRGGRVKLDVLRTDELTLPQAPHATE